MQTNSPPTELEHLISGVGKLRYFIWEFPYQVITNLMTSPRDFIHHAYTYLPKGGELNLSLFGLF